MRRMPRDGGRAADWLAVGGCGATMCVEEGIAGACV